MVERGNQTASLHPNRGTRRRSADSKTAMVPRQCRSDHPWNSSLPEARHPRHRLWGGPCDQANPRSHLVSAKRFQRVSNCGSGKLAGIVSHTLDDLLKRLRHEAQDPRDPFLMGGTLRVLDERHALSLKLQAEPGLAEILSELYQRLVSAFGGAAQARGLRILDIACGSNSSHAPQVFHLRVAGALRPVERQGDDGFSPLFEPWFPRMLHALGAEAVGVDMGDLGGESFEHYVVNLADPGALDFLPNQSFDAVQDSRLFGSPEFAAQFPDRSDRVPVAREILRQEARLLKPGGTVIHSDAQQVVKHASS